MKSLLLKIVLVILGIYAIICGLLYFYQEKLIFQPQKLPKDYEFVFFQKFEELFITSTDGKKLNGLLFKADSSKGLIFYLHGNAGSLETWAEVASTYTSLSYDVFILDYRSYGKSEGVINGQEQLFADNQAVYDILKGKYPEDKIIILGYSIGTGMASKLASYNNAKLLILQAPYYSLKDMMKHTYPYVPTILLKYKFETNEYLKNCKMPIAIFHGENDEVIYYGSSLKLQKEFKSQDTLISLKSQKHNGITYNKMYNKELELLLKR